MICLIEMIYYHCLAVLDTAIWLLA